MRRRLLAALAIAVCTLSGAAAYQHARSGSEGWREIAWPFPRDGWPAGRAFHCATAVCGDEVEVYVRPKIGFCNCDSGVADDAVSPRCDLLVAVAQGKADAPAVQRAALEFLSTSGMARWMMLAMNGG